MRNKYLIIIVATLLFSCGAHEKKKSSSNLLGKAVHLSDNEVIELKNKPNARIRESFNEISQIDSITIAFSETFNKVLEPNILLLLKESSDHLYTDTSINIGVKNYSSKIEDISNNHILIKKIYFLDDNNVYDFVIVNADFTKRKLGIIQFHKEDEKQATTLLNSILKDFKF